MDLEITLRVNGTARRLSVDTRTTLLDALRERLGLTGAKKGCDHGQCGSCTVLVEGRRINSCLTLAVAHGGSAGGGGTSTSCGRFSKTRAFLNGENGPRDGRGSYTTVCARNGWPAALASGKNSVSPTAKAATRARHEAVYERCSKRVGRQTLLSRRWPPERRGQPLRL